MSKYGWGWIWKSWFSPIGLMARLFGYTPKEDRKPEVAENEYRITVVPVVGYGMKELTEVGKRLFGKYGESKESIAETLKAWQECCAENDYFDVMDHFTVAVTLEEREQIIKDLGKSKCWIIYYDEYDDLYRTADSIVKRELRSRKRDEIVLELTKKMEKDPVNKETVGELIKSRMEDTGEEQWLAAIHVEGAMKKHA